MGTETLKTRYFPGVGESPYTLDFLLHEIPVIQKEDSPELKERKHRFIKRKLASLRSILRTP